jgi:hypothetical protein
MYEEKLTFVALHIAWTRSRKKSVDLGRSRARRVRQHRLDLCERAVDVVLIVTGWSKNGLLVDR